MTDKLRCRAGCSVFIRSPVLQTRSYVLRMFLLFNLSTHFRRLLTDTLETFPHDVASAPKEALLHQFPESAP